MSRFHRFKASLVLASSLAISALLAACGSGETVDPLVPARVISFGDGLSDVGHVPGQRYTVNDNTVNIWAQRVASNYGLSLTASSAGGLGFARGNARVNTVNAGAAPISAQINTFLTSGSIGNKDLILVDAGVTELYELAVLNTNDTNLANAAEAAGRALAQEVLRLTAAGGKYVVIANAPDLGKSPYARTPNRTAALSIASRRFNDGLKIALANVTSGVFLVDNEAYINTLHSSPGTLGSGGNVTTAACGATAITSCVATTNPSYGVFLYADDRHLTPRAHQLLGDNAYNKIKARW